MQALPEKPRLANAPDFVPPRDDSFLPKLHHQFAQRVHQPRRRLLQALVIRAECLRLRIILRIEPDRNPAAELHRLRRRIAVGLDGRTALRIFQYRVFSLGHLLCSQINRCHPDEVRPRVFTRANEEGSAFFGSSGAPPSRLSLEGS